MKTKLVKFFTVLFVFVLASCSHKQNNNVFIDDALFKDYPIDPKDAKRIFASSIFDSIVYISLPLSDSTIIGSIEKLEVYDSCFYFWDKIEKKIWCFDFMGNLVFQIDKRGQGPGEYLQIYDFNIDKGCRQIQILDRNLRKILCYDLLNGNYIKDIKIEVAASQFAILNNGFLLYTRGADIFMGKDKSKYGYNLFVSDSLGNLQEERYCPYNEIIDDLIGFNTFTSHDQQISFHYARNDTIYEFDHTGHLECKLLFDFGKYRIPLETVNTGQRMRDYDNDPNYTRVYKPFHTLQHVFITYVFENRIRFLLMHKQSEKIINGR